MPTDPTAPRGDYIPANLADEKPPHPGIPADLWLAVRSTLAASTVANLSNLAAMLAERENEAEELASRHEGHGPDCVLGILAAGIALGVAASRGMIAGMMDVASATLTPTQVTTARQLGERQAATAPGFMADSARLEEALRHAFTHNAKAGRARPKRPPAGTVH
jgi:hypothetical protein